MRPFSYITVGKILKTLKDEGISISRATFYSMEKDGLFMTRKAARGWRVFTPDEAKIIIQLVKENYGIK